MIDYIKTLKSGYKLALVSNVSGRRALDSRFKPGELDSLFDQVIASGDIGIEKPDPLIYQRAAIELGVEPSECLFIDDIPEYCAAAERVGMKAIRSIDPAQTIKDITHALEGAP